MENLQLNKNNNKKYKQFSSDINIHQILKPKQISLIKQFQKKNLGKLLNENKIFENKKKLSELKDIQLTSETINNNLKYNKCLPDSYDLTNINEDNIGIDKYKISKNLLNNKVNLSLFYYGGPINIFSFFEKLCLENNSNSKYFLKFDDISDTNNEQLLIDYLNMGNISQIIIPPQKNAKMLNVNKKFLKINKKSNNIQVFKGEELFQKINLKPKKNSSKSNKNGNNGKDNNGKNNGEGNNGNSNNEKGNNGNGNNGKNNGEGNNSSGGSNSTRFFTKNLSGISISKMSSEDREFFIKSLTELLKDTVIEVDENKLDNYKELQKYIYQKKLNIIIQDEKFQNKYITSLNDFKTLGDIHEYKSDFGLNTKINISLPDFYSSILKLVYIKNKIQIKQNCIISFNKICEMLKVISSDSKNNKNTTSLINNLNKYIKNMIQNLKDIFKNYYLMNLTFHYNSKKYSIHPTEMINETSKQVNKYFDLLQNILEEILDSNKFKTDKNIKKYIENTFLEKVKNIFVSGFVISVLYNYDKNSKCNIPNNYLSQQKYYDTSVLDHIKGRKLDINDIEKGSYYFDNQIKKIIYIGDTSIIDYIKKSNTNTKNSNSKKSDILFNIRPILSKKKLKQIHQVYIKYCTQVLTNIQSNIDTHITQQTKYFHVIDWLRLHNKKDRILDYEKYVNRKMKKMFLHNQTNEVILKKAKTEFKKIVKELHQELLDIIKSRENSEDIVSEYNFFLDKYVIWLIFIINHMINFSNDSKQKLIFNNIFQIFLDNKHISKWNEKCKKNNLNYFIPVKSTSPETKTIMSTIKLSKPTPGTTSINYYNLTTGKTESKLSKFDYTVVTTRTNNLSTDDFTCWTGPMTELKVEHLIKYYMKYLESYEVKEKIECSMEDVTNQILMEKKRILENTNNINNLNRKMEEVNRQIAEYESSQSQCKYLISYEQLLKEILKVKYPLRITNTNNANLSVLDSKVREYQNELMRIIS